jgi:hypothetical protein
LDTHNPVTLGVLIVPPVTPVILTAGFPPGVPPE